MSGEASARWKRWFAPLVVGVTYVWSMVAILGYRAAEAPPGTITLRIGHWQLEASVREALDHMAAEYSAMRAVRGLPPVRIVQDAIPEMTYIQWLTTQLMGGTAPDMLEVGLGGLPYHLWVQYFNRYFVSLTPHVNRPNPHNAGGSLADTPLRLTFKDGMREAYVEEMQEYMSIPLSQFGVRIFYNKDLLRRLTGRERPPEEYRDFLAVCEQIRAQRDARGQPYIPIAGSKYHLPHWEGPMFDPLTYLVKEVADFNRDGFVDNGEQYAAVKTGRLSFRHPAIVARHRMMWEVTEFFQAGFTGLSRDEAVFLFAQERAVFMTTGTWDARSLLEQAEGFFEVGVMDYPLPAADDPVYGPVMRGPNYERIGGGARFGITRTCRHPDIALDFLLFITSQTRNEELNAIIGWIPSVRDTAMPAFLEGFEPHLKGVYGNFNPTSLGGETWLKWTQLYAEFQIKRKTFDEIVDVFEPFYKTRGIVDFMDAQKDWRRGMHANEQFLAGIRAAAMIAEGEAGVSQWAKYRILTTARQIFPEIQHTRQVKLVLGTLDLPPQGPYEYSERVLNRVRERQAGAAATPQPGT